MSFTDHRMASPVPETSIAAIINALICGYVYASIYNIDPRLLDECARLLHPSIVAHLEHLVGETRRLIATIQETPDATFAIVTENRFAARMVVRALKYVGIKTHRLRMAKTRLSKVEYICSECSTNYYSCKCERTPLSPSPLSVNTCNYQRDDQRTVIFASIECPYWQPGKGGAKPIQEVLVRGVTGNSSINVEFIGTDEYLLRAVRGCNPQEMRTFKCVPERLDSDFPTQFAKLLSTPSKHLEKAIAKHGLEPMPDTEDNRQIINILQKKCDEASVLTKAVH